MTHLELALDIAATPEQVFAALVDWESQGEWMLGTRVWVPKGATGVGVGGQLAAFTGIGRIGFLDTMTITRWDEPHRVDVVHTGRVVRGTGTFVVEAAAEGRARFVWAEDLDLPLGALGRVGWLAVRPFFVAGVRRSLHRFAQLVEQQPSGVQSS